jgi:hypothetical protein
MGLVSEDSRLKACIPQQQSHQAQPQSGNKQLDGRLDGVGVRGLNAVTASPPLQQPHQAQPKLCNQQLAIAGTAELGGVDDSKL